MTGSFDKNAYRRRAEAGAKKSPLLRDCFRAFWTGGSICVLGELLKGLYLSLGLAKEVALSTVTVSLIALAVLFTALGWFDRIARYAGSGTLVPVTGFANAVAAPAMDTKSEGMILGVGAKIFTVAGPVLLYGILSGAVYGVVLWIVSLF